MKIFITGATGYLGYNFAITAIQQGHQVLCLRRSSSISLFDKKTEASVQWVSNENLLNLRDVVHTFQPDILFHAAWSGVRGSERDNAEIQFSNISLSQQLFELYPYKQIIALGSQAEYGLYDHIVSEVDKLSPISLYGKCKKTVCENLKKYCEANNIEWHWIRIFTVFGEKQTGGLIKIFAEKCLNNECSFETTLGEQKYSYLYAYDFSCALCNVLGITGKSGVYNLSQPNNLLSNRELLEKIKKLLGSDIQILYGAKPYEKNQVMLMDGNVNKFENAFGCIPHSNFESSLEQTLNIIKTQYKKDE